MKRAFEFAILIIMALCLLFASVPAQAGPIYGFDNITNNNTGDATIGEAQLFVEVTAGPGADQVLFRFFNIGPEASSITDIYFEDGSLLGLAGLIDADDNTNMYPPIVGNPGVDFTQGSADPGDLPGGNNASPPFSVTLGFLADSDNPPPKEGVNPNESLWIFFDLKSDPIQKTYADVLADLGSGDLRIGIHVQGFDGGGSESFINDPTAVPEPGSVVAMAAIGLLGLVGFARRRWMKTA